MQVTQIQNTNFESKIPKKRFISDNMRASVESLLIRMNGELNRIQDGDYFKSTITTKLHYNNKAVFEDERRLTKKVQQNEQMRGFSNLKIGKKIVLDIDNESGEIIDYVKPFYKPFFLVLKKAENVLQEMRTNFYNNDVMKKEQLTINDLTPEGKQKIKRMVLSYEKQQLEKIIKELEDTSK